eukprot:scaffold30956_cov61-Phaeocystis_antarctica.AAC.3
MVMRIEGCARRRRQQSDRLHVALRRSFVKRRVPVLAAAVCIGVNPPFAASSNAPAATNALIAFARFCLAAQSSGVAPPSSRASIDAPAAVSASIADA